jgi:metal-sulfur cluster biosynthetic enzyme
MGPQIIQNVEHVLYEAGAQQVAVDIVWEPAWTPDAMTPDLKKLLGIEPDEMDEPEPEPVYEPPPAPAKKKRGLLGWLFN